MTDYRSEGPLDVVEFKEMTRRLREDIREFVRKLDTVNRIILMIQLILIESPIRKRGRNKLLVALVNKALIFLGYPPMSPASINRRANRLWHDLMRHLSREVGMSKSKRNTPALKADERKIDIGLIRQLLAEVLAEPAEMLSAVPDEVALDEIRRSFAANRTNTDRKRAIKQAKRLLETGEMNHAEIKPCEGSRERSTVRGEGDETMAESGGIHSDKEQTESHVAGRADEEIENAPQRLGFQFSFRKLRELGRGGQGIVYLVEGEDGFAARRARNSSGPAYTTAMLHSGRTWSV